MEALEAAVKAELGEDGLRTCGGAEVPAAEHGHGWSVSVVNKAEVKSEVSVDLYRETLVNVEIKSETSRPSRARTAVAWPPGTAAHGLAEGMTDEGGERRVQPKRGAKRRTVSYMYADVDSVSGSADEEWTFAAPRRRRRKAVQVTQVTLRGAGRFAPPEEAADRSGEESPSAVAGADTCRPSVAKGDAGWKLCLAKLKAYMCSHGDCNVPQRWTEDPPLGRWVADQRRYKKQLDRGEPSQGMTAARAAKLEALGFAWELSAAELSKQCSNATRDDAGWEAQLAKLTAYKRRHGDCIVPRGWAEDPPLGRWVGKQRTFKKALDRGQPCEGMTAARMAKLDALGFAWVCRRN